MPHIHLRTSANLIENMDISDILAGLASEICRFSFIEPQSVKAYHSLHTNWVTDERAPEGFVHLTVRVLAGREALQLEEMGKALYNVLTQHFASSIESKEAMLTLEIREMPRELYWKSG